MGRCAGDCRQHASMSSRSAGGQWEASSLSASRPTRLRNSLTRPWLGLGLGFGFGLGFGWGQGPGLVTSLLEQCVPWEAPTAHLPHADAQGVDVHLVRVRVRVMFRVMFRVRLGLGLWVGLGLGLGLGLE